MPGACSVTNKFSAENFSQPRLAVPLTSGTSLCLSSPTRKVHWHFAFFRTKKFQTCCLVFFVPGVGLEPTRTFVLGILSPLCLPFHHPGVWINVTLEATAGIGYKSFLRQKCSHPRLMPALGGTFRLSIHDVKNAGVLLRGGHGGNRTRA